MKWHVDDIPLLVTHLPRALHDLLHHEDPVFVQHVQHVPLVTDSAAPRHHLVVDAPPPAISIEKSLDPLLLRSVHNIGLLLHDYISQLPAYEVSSPEAERLVEHWRSILLEQPQRLATGHPSHWREPSVTAFWREKLVDHAKKLGVSPDVMMDAWDDWQRASGVGHATGHPLQVQAMQQKQWQDLVIRSRLHRESMLREMEWYRL